MSRRPNQKRPIFAARGPFAVECPGCREHVGVDRDLVGRVAGCPRCHCPFVVPQPDGAEAGAPAAAERESAPAPRSPARAPDPPLDAEHHSPATTGSPARDEPVVFSDPPVPAARIRAGQAPAATTAEPAACVSPWDATAVAAADPPIPDPPADAHLSTSPDATLAFHDPVKTVRSGNTQLEIRRLTPEEKRSRHARRNLLILLVGAALLVALVVVLGSRGR